MRDAPVLVTTPTGTVGREVVHALRRHGVPVRAGVRHPERYVAPDDVDVVHLDLDDPGTHATAVEGARGLFLLRPREMGRPAPFAALADAAARAGVGHCVFQSIEGAERQRWLPHRRIEQAVEASGMGWTHLRANHFMQNLTDPYREAIRAGTLRLPAGEGRVAFVDCADVAEVAALAFADPPAHSSRAHVLTGPRAWTFAEVAEELSRCLGRAIRYQPAGALGYAGSLRREGLPLPGVVILTAVHITIRRGAAEHVDPTLGEILQRPPRTLEHFVAAHQEELT